MHKQSTGPKKYTITGCMQHDMQHTHEQMGEHIVAKSTWAFWIIMTEREQIRTTHWEHAVDDEQVAAPARPTQWNPIRTNHRLYTQPLLKPNDTIAK